MIKSTVAALVVVAAVGAAWLSGAFNPSSTADATDQAALNTGVPVSMGSCCDPELKDPTLADNSAYKSDAMMLPASTDAPAAMSCCGDDQATSPVSTEAACCSSADVKDAASCCSEASTCCSDKSTCSTDAACTKGSSCCKNDKPAETAAISTTAGASTCCGGNTEATGGPTCCGGCTSE